MLSNVKGSSQNKVKRYKIKMFMTYAISQVPTMPVSWMKILFFFIVASFGMKCPAFLFKLFTVKSNYLLHIRAFYASFFLWSQVTANACNNISGSLKKLMTVA